MKCKDNKDYDKCSAQRQVQIISRLKCNPVLVSDMIRGNFLLPFSADKFTWTSRLYTRTINYVYYLFIALLEQLTLRYSELLEVRQLHRKWISVSKMNWVWNAVYLCINTVVRKLSCKVVLTLAFHYVSFSLINVSKYKGFMCFVRLF